MFALIRFLQFIEWLENLSDFLDVIVQPEGILATTAILFYCSMRIFQYDSFSATLLSCIVAIALIQINSEGYD